MGKVSFTNLKLKTEVGVSKLNFKDTEIEILNYLPIEDKYDLVMITLQNSEEEGFYNPIKIDKYFHLYLIYMYTNISFTDKQKENDSKLYDALRSSGLIDEVIMKMPEEEYDTLYQYLEEIIEKQMQYKHTAAGIINKIITDLPAQAQAAMDIVENFDPDKFQAVKDFARAANGDRDIK